MRVVLVLVALVGMLQFQSPPVHRGFAFHEGGCELGPGYCAARVPKQWTADEIAHVSEAVDVIVGSRLGRLILSRCQANGARTFQRYSRSVNASRAPIGAGGDAAFHRDSFVTAIDINDPFFATRHLRDEFSGSPGYLVAARILLHECLHVVDTESQTAAFAELVGFVKVADTWKFGILSADDAHALRQFNREFPRLADSRLALNRLDRETALGMKPVRLPTMLASQSPQEAFAEIGSHLVLDPRARSYLPKAVVARFDRFFVELAQEK